MSFSWLVDIAKTFPGLHASWQKSTEVAIRQAGNRCLDPPEPAAPQAIRDVDYAWLAEAAYSATYYARSVRRQTGRAPSTLAYTILEQTGWTRWTDFPDRDLLYRIEDSHLRVEVWERATTTTSTVVITFGGTVAKVWADWEANLRWFIPFHHDEYTELVRDLAPAFVDAYKRRFMDPQSRINRDTALHATGHSLGGGLAQQFAYALPVDPLVPRVSRVLAFDPSPVTGFFSVAAKLRDYNTQGLDIDRIYARGEVLAILRSLLSVFIPPSQIDPAIRGIRYQLTRTLDPISDHAMLRLAKHIQSESGRMPMRYEEMVASAA